MKKLSQNRGVVITVSLMFLIAFTVMLSAQVKKTKTKTKTMTQGTQTMMQASSDVRILHFGKPVAPGTMMATTIAGSGGTSIPRYTVDAGETFLLSWTFTTKNAIRVSATITGGGRTTTLNPGTPTDASGGWKRYKNQRNFIIRKSGFYTLKVAGFPGGSSAVKEKKVQFIVKSPKLLALKPTVNPTSRKVTFKVKNTGQIAASGRFKVYYQIQGRSPMRSLVQSNFTTDSMEVGRNRTATLGEITLPESAWQSAQIWMRVTINLLGRVTFSDGPKDFTYNWPTHTLTIDSGNLQLVGLMLNGHILIHNYSNPSGDKVKNLPMVRDASSISLMGEDFTFHFDRLKYEVIRHHYFFVNNFRANLGGNDFLTVENGKLVMNISFNCGRTTREVKGWVRRPVMKDYSDDGSPDVDIQRFNMKLALTPILRGNKISYRNPTLTIDSRMRFPGGWSFLNTFKDTMNRKVKDSVQSYFTSLMNSNTIKTLLEDKITQVVMDLGAAFGIHDLVSIQGRGGEIIVTYR